MQMFVIGTQYCKVFIDAVPFLKETAGVLDSALIALDNKSVCGGSFLSDGKLF